MKELMIVIPVTGQASAAVNAARGFLKSLSLRMIESDVSIPSLEPNVIMVPPFRLRDRYFEPLMNELRRDHISLQFAGVRLFRPETLGASLVLPATQNNDRLLETVLSILRCFEVEVQRPQSHYCVIAESVDPEYLPHFKEWVQGGGGGGVNVPAETARCVWQAGCVRDGMG